MKFLALLASVLTACASIPPVAKPSPSDQAASVRLLRLDYDGDGAMDGYCTAWALVPRVWATAGHCADNEDGGVTVPFVMTRGVPAEGHWVAVMTPESGVDAAVFTSTASGPGLPLAVTVPAFGDRVHYIGFPEGHYGVYEGLWAGPDNTEGGEVMFTGFAWGGASGSPVMNEAGEVVGILVSGYRGRPYTYITPVAAFKGMVP
jgi:V8-like Glu-specific endopeptidase